jgi:hypothetical protein
MNLIVLPCLSVCAAVVEVVLLNQAIYNALPFSTAGHDAFVISVKAFLQSRNVNGYLDIIQMDCYVCLLVSLRGCISGASMDVY